LAKTNYQFERRQRDLAKKRKQEEKRQRKLAPKTPAENEGKGPSTDQHGSTSVEAEDETAKSSPTTTP
jgi:hypothetical protein